jgi:hypothetical protein
MGTVHPVEQPVHSLISRNPDEVGVETARTTVVSKHAPECAVGKLGE